MPLSGFVNCCEAFRMTAPIEGMLAAITWTAARVAPETARQVLS